MFSHVSSVRLLPFSEIRENCTTRSAPPLDKATFHPSLRPSLTCKSIMGSSTSKPARTLGSKVSQAVSRATPSAPSTAKAAQSVAQEARQSPQRSSAARSNAAAAAHAAAGGSTHPDPQYAPSGHTKRDEDTRRQQRQSSEHKSADIMRDAFDPQFLENLSQIGQVKVPKNATNFSPVSTVE